MRTLRLCLEGTIILALLGGLGIAVVAQSEQGIAEGEVESALFVGNSLTYRDGGVETQVTGLAARRPRITNSC